MWVAFRSLWLKQEHKQKLEFLGSCYATYNPIISIFHGEQPKDSSVSCTPSPLACMAACPLGSSPSPPLAGHPMLPSSKPSRLRRCRSMWPSPPAPEAEACSPGVTWRWCEVPCVWKSPKRLHWWLRAYYLSKYNVERCKKFIGFVRYQ